MTNAKQYTLFALGAFVGFNVANNVEASTNDTQERQYGYGYYGHPHDQPGHPQYERRRMEQTSQQKLSKESSRNDGHGWSRSGHPRYQSNTSRTQQTQNVKDESRYGYGYYGHPHDQPGHPLYKPQTSTEQNQKRSIPRGYGQPTQQPEVAE